MKMKKNPQKKYEKSASLVYIVLQATLLARRMRAPGGGRGGHRGPGGRRHPGHPSVYQRKY